MTGRRRTDAHHPEEIIPLSILNPRPWTDEEPERLSLYRERYKGLRWQVFVNLGLFPGSIAAALKAQYLKLIHQTYAEHQSLGQLSESRLVICKTTPPTPPEQSMEQYSEGSRSFIQGVQNEPIEISSDEENDIGEGSTGHSSVASGHGQQLSARTAQPPNGGQARRKGVLESIVSWNPNGGRILISCLERWRLPHVRRRSIILPDHIVRVSLQEAYMPIKIQPMITTKDIKSPKAFPLAG
ncbi:hypothetical protein BDV06DRAFT_229130 [Aspergillus oleicola]